MVIYLGVARARLGLSEALLGGGGGGGPVIPYPFNSEHSYPLSLKVSTALYPKISRVEFSIIP